MCLAIFKPKKESFPSKEIIKNAWENNPHGAGMAIVQNNGKVKIIKGIMTLKALNKILSNKEFLGLDVLLHFRFATSGHVIPEMTHPFPLSGKNSDILSLELEVDSALIHNGVLFPPKMNSGYSDTAILSKLIALKKLNDETILDIMGPYNKLAIASSEGVRLLGPWNEIDGIHYSNTYSIPRKRTFWNDDSMLDSYFLSKYIQEENYDEDRYYYDSRFDIKEVLEYCPLCDSDHVESIGIRSTAMECLDCGAVFNETEFLSNHDIFAEIACNDLSTKKKGA